MARTKNKHRNSDEIQHYCRDIQHVVRPVTPSRKKAVEVAKDFLRPQIHSTLARISMRKFDHGNTLRPKEEQQRNQPEPNRDSAIRSDRGDNVQIKYRNDE